MPLTSQQARAVVDAAEATAQALGVPVIVAVVDAGVHLKAFSRMDGAVLGSIDVALKKARTSALFQADSDAVWEYCRPGAPAPALELSNDGLAPFGGGVPLRSAAGEWLGAVGVSGGAVSQDQQIAQAAAAVLASALSTR
ncbi:glycolate utilization protein [Luteitalea sp. TBR-22]|uniref:GlcG/HbpS family heme-binding protein n=1 Tax=Luteitalea sp. TBR-22 TaxID=2802971 RepID=UPI001AF6AC73|nr:heme-binding protein [Luteitalea sp. TBR-22]BCS32590.1 glycolate utilization protein [Luteitalea sp. TBR-22]